MFKWISWEWRADKHRAGQGQVFNMQVAHFSPVHSLSTSQNTLVLKLGARIGQEHKKGKK